MAKHRKTRQEKILADQRHVLYHLETDSAQVSEPLEKKEAKINIMPFVQPQTTPHQTGTSYAYVVSDIRKTVFITSSIILLQITLFFVLGRV